MTSSRVPPHDLNAEMSLLGALMLSPSVDVTDLSPDDFYRPAHQRIFDAIMSLRSRGDAVDAITVAAELTAKGTLEQAGGKMYLLEVSGSTPIAANASEYARIVRRNSQLRTIIDVGTRAVVAAYDATDADDVLADAVTTLLALQQEGGGAEATVADAIRRRLEDYRNPTDTLLLPGSGVRLHFGDLTVIGGRPGTGKTAYAVQVADVLASRGRKVAFLSYEMDLTEIADRLVSRATGQPSDYAYDGLTDGEVSVFEAACKSLLANRNLTLKQAAGMREAELASFIRSFAHRGGKVVVLDYIQLAFDSRSGEYPDLTRLMRLLQSVGKSTGVAILALSQYSRDGDGIPRLSHLRGSGAIEQEAANVALMWSPDDDEQFDYKAKKRDERYILDPHDASKRLVRIHWAKVRHGKSRIEYHLFDGARMHFEPLDREA